VPPQELIGASLFLGLVAVVTISRHGAYMLAFMLGRTALAPGELGVMVLNIAGFTASLWLLALRRWAWRLSVAYAVVMVGLRAFYVFDDLAPGIVRGAGDVEWLAALGEFALGFVFLIVLAYLVSEETRERLNARDEYRQAQVRGA
jgi:hypothetical protein